MIPTQHRFSPTRLLDAALDLVFPPRCCLCGRLDSPWCADCAHALDELAPLPGDAPPPITAILSLSVHGDPLRTVIHTLKYESNRAQAQGLARVLGAPLAAAYAHVRDTWQIDLIVPVPLHPNRLRTRGYNQSDLLAQALAGSTALPCHTGVLVRERDTGSQVGRTQAERHAEMNGAFRALPGASSRRVLLIDDVLTTGATLTACAEALLAAGAERVCALTLTRA